MPRHNPRRARSCRGCKDPEIVATKAIEKAIAATPKVLVPAEEGARMWRHVLFGTGTCIGMMHGYAEQGMPGVDVEQIQALIVSLDKVAKTVKAKNEDV